MWWFSFFVEAIESAGFEFLFYDDYLFSVKFRFEKYMVWWRSAENSDGKNARDETMEIDEDMWKIMKINPWF